MSKIVRYMVFRKFSGEFTPNHLDGYMVKRGSGKPGDYTEWGSRREAHGYTIKQAAQICRSFNNQPGLSGAEQWGFCPINTWVPS